MYSKKGGKRQKWPTLPILNLPGTLKRILPDIRFAAKSRVWDLVTPVEV